MKTVKVLDEIKILSKSLIYRVLEEKKGYDCSYGFELEYECDGTICRKIFYSVADNKEYVLKMCSDFAENVVFPEELEETAEQYVCSVRA